MGQPQTEEAKEKVRKTLAETRAKKQEQNRRFPHALLIGVRRSNDDTNGAGVSLILAGGSETCSIEVRKFGKWPDMGRYEMLTIEEDLDGLARFINALVCRYNASVDNINHVASRTKLKQLKSIQPDSNGR